MKKNLFIFFGFCLLVGFRNAGAYETERIYVVPNQIVFSDNNVFVFHENDWKQVFAIFSDKNGLFVETAQPSPETWYCPDCRTYHSVSIGCPKRR